MGQVGITLKAVGWPNIHINIDFRIPELLASTIRDI